MKETIFYKDQQVELEYDIIAPGIYVYRNAIPKEWNCIERIENALVIPGTRFKWKQAGLGYGDTNLEHRRCKDFKIKENILEPRDEYSSDMLDMHKQIMDSLKTCMSHYTSKNFLNKIDYYECINIVRYGSGEYFKTHTDDGDPYRCTVSSVGYPNDNYSGGELYFPLFDVKHKPTAGDFVISPSAYVYAHSSEPVTDDGIKYSFVIMADRNEFAHRADSPVYHAEDIRKKYNV
jgi:hypothetical protein